MVRLANLFYSSIDIMPELQLAKRKTVTLVSDLVRLFDCLVVCLLLRPSVCLSVCLPAQMACLFMSDLVPNKFLLNVIEYLGFKIITDCMLFLCQKLLT